ncbi:hypothetical protein D9M71_574660 [compost metagenome]
MSRLKLSTDTLQASLGLDQRFASLVNLQIANAKLLSQAGNLLSVQLSGVLGFDLSRSDHQRQPLDFAGLRVE